MIDLLSKMNVIIAFICIINQYNLINAYSYPGSIKNVLTKMTQSTQQALQNRCSRMEIELPPGVDFGVKGDVSKKEKKGFSGTDKVLSSNREAARLFTDMFSQIQSSTTVLFPTENAAYEARNLWSASYRGSVMSIDKPGQGSKGYGKLRSRRFSAQEQEQALFGDEGIYIPDKTEVLIIPGARSRDWKKLIQLEEKLGEAVCMIFINTRAQLPLVKNKDNAMKDEDRDYFLSTFTPVFHYAPPPFFDPDSKRELLMYYEYGDKWSIAEKEQEKGFLSAVTGSSFKTIWEGTERPSPEMETVQKLL